MFKKECSKCGIDKEPSYVSSSYCKTCKSEFDKARRLKKRLESGKKPWGSGPSTLCSKCGNEKTGAYLKGGYCGPCKCAIAKEKAIQKRIAEGKPAFRSGPNPVCRCGKVKERINSHECNSCKRIRDNEWRLRTGRTKKHRTGLCACGQPFAPYSKCYCSACATKWKTEYLEKNPEQKEKLYARNRQRKVSSYEEFIKYQTRYTTGNAIKKGILIKQPCEVCGTTEDIEAHHDDYTKPYDIRWLCRKHHNEHHHPSDKTENT